VEVTAEELRRYYASLSDSALLAMVRDELTEVGQLCYDEEVLRRGLAQVERPPTVDKAEVAHSESAAVGAWLRAYVARFRQRYPRRVVMQRVIVSVVLTAGAAAWGVWRHREDALSRLWTQVSGVQGSDQAFAAVREIATYRGERSTSMLLAISYGHPSPLPTRDVQVEAVKALSGGRDPQVSIAIAGLLRPQEILPIREAAAEYLQDGSCPDECIARMLHYLERVWNGELNIEDRTRYPASFGDFADRQRARDRDRQQSAYVKVLQALRRRGTATLQVMIDVYGLNTRAPSTFALAILPRIRPRDVCQVLLESRNQMGEPDEFFDAPRKELAAAMQALKCQ
jgi:hypothetical protein